MRRKKWNLPFAGLGVLLTAGGAHAQSVWRVNAAAEGAATGLTWADAFTDLQAALAAAQPGDEVWVAAGAYRPAPPAGDRDTSFAMRPGVALYGGFLGNESERDARDWNEHRTVLSGDLNSDDAENFENSGENSYHVVVAYNVGRASILDGFIIRAGRADGAGFGPVPESQEQGSGLNVYYASPTVRHCTFEQNWSSNHGAVNDHGDLSVYEDCTFQCNYSEMFGAGLYIHNHTAATITRCGFFNNLAAGEGGGLYSRSDAGCTVVLCTFVGNQAGFGAGMYNAEGSSNTVTDCEFNDNIATLGGGGLYAISATPSIERCAFTGNMAGLAVKGGGGGGGGSGGGGLWTEGGAASIRDCLFTANLASFGAGVYHIHDARAEVTRCTFLDNHAAEAGALYTLNSPTLVSHCSFRANSASGTNFSVGGAVSNYFSNSTFSDCLFELNSAELGGGGVYNEGEHPIILNCTFTANSAFSDTEGWGGAVLNGYFTHAEIGGCVMSRNRANRGGGIHNMAFAEPDIFNCTIVANESVAQELDNAGGIQSHPLSVSRVANCVVVANAPGQLGGAHSAVRYSAIEGGYDGPGAFGIFAADPGLVRLPSPGEDTVWGTADDDAGDLRLAAASMCIDAGENSGAEPLGSDAAGDPRLMDDRGVPDSGSGEAPIVDIGAFEFQDRSCLADFNRSGVVDSQDLFDFLAAFFEGESDVNRDGAVTSQDFFDYLAWFFEGCAR